MHYQRLLGSAAALQKIINIIPSPVFVKDPAHHYVLVNQAMVQILGRPREAVLGKADAELFGPAEAAQFMASDDAVLHRRETVELEECFPGAGGDVRNVLVRKTLLRLDGGTVLIVGVISDVTSYRMAVTENLFLSRHDMLTGLPNRTAFQERLQDSIGLGQRALDNVAVLIIDLDGFKAVNDAYGHAAGDELLRVIAKRLAGAVRADDLVARLGGDEFGILLRGGPALPEAAERIASGICDAIAAPVPLRHSQARVSASIGITYYRKPETSMDELIHQADIAMYSVKRQGRHGVKTYEPKLELLANRQVHADLRHALERHELFIVYQPLWNPPDGQLTGYEALLRWTHPHFGPIAPAVFIPIAEQSGLIATLGNFVLHAACEAAADWPAPLKVAINVSPMQLVADRFLSEVESALVCSGLEAGRLELEVTEAKPVLDDPGALMTLQQLHARGVRIALDDFGSGTASLDMMHLFAFDRMKIDTRFVAGLPADERAAAIVGALIALAHDLRASVTAEGVERMEQALCLMELGCDEMQGYLFGHPNARPSIL